jgi:hypothetical protein
LRDMRKTLPLSLPIVEQKSGGNGTHDCDRDPGCIDSIGPIVKDQI